MKFNELGRSMVEMLGVLAIIGVLSVGAISGYSKAMTKYKLNKQAEQLNTLLTAIAQYRHEFGKSNNQNIKEIFSKLKLIPEDMIKDNTNYLYDVFNASISISTNGTLEPPVGPYFYQSLGINYVVDSSTSYEICQNIYTVTKSYSDIIFRTVVNKTLEDDSGGFGDSFYGDKYCHKSNRLCLRNMSLDDIYTNCQYCADAKRCIIWISIPIQDYLVN